MAHALVIAHPDVTYAETFVKALGRQLPEYTFTLGAAELVPFGSAVRASLQQAFTGIDLDPRLVQRQAVERQLARTAERA
jgi:hypothetical protein